MNSMEGKNVLITGVNGFVGAWLARHLIQKKANVYGFIRRRSDGGLGAGLKDKDISEELKLIDGDVLDVSSIGYALDISEPDYVFHLAAQSFIPKSFRNPYETFSINTMGTLNLLEAVRIKNMNPKIVFAGSSEEYGLVFSSQKQYADASKKYGTIFPEPEKIPEIPISEKNPLRPMSPYAVSKVQGEFMFRNYNATYGMKTIVSRAFNHEGAGRGIMFVTSAITNQVMKVVLGEADDIRLGNVSAFRDWSHIQDIMEGYSLLAEKGKPGEVYNQGSMRTNSVLSYLLLSIEHAGLKVKSIKTMKNNKEIVSPTEMNSDRIFSVSFEKTKADTMLLNEEISFEAEDEGLVVETDKQKINVLFDKDKFRPSEVPILFSDTTKIKESLGFKTSHSLGDIIKDQLNYYMNPENRTPPHHF